MDTKEFIEHLIALMRGEEVERLGWDDNCELVELAAPNRIEVSLDGQMFVLTVEHEEG